MRPGGLPPGEFPRRCSALSPTASPFAVPLVGTRGTSAEALSFDVDGKVKADIELQPLTAINQVFGRLVRGEVPLRMVLKLAA